MTRVRLSITVDRENLATCRRLLGVGDSELVDRALQALVKELEAMRELAALAAHPYGDDPDLAWEALPGTDLPYRGDVPKDVIRLAAKRRNC
jgi:hypothetical protein